MRATQLKNNRNVNISKKETGPAGHTLLCPWANLPSQRLCQESDRQRNTGSCAELSSDMLCKCVDIRFCFATPAIAQLVEHLTVDPCSNQMVPGSIPGGRILGGGGGVPCDTQCGTCEFGPVGHPEHTSLLQRTVAAPCNEAPSAAPWNGSLWTMMCSCSLHLGRQRETLCALERHIAIKAGYRNGSGCATLPSLWPCFRWVALCFG